MLPNPGMSFTPFDPLPASDLNDMVENIESLADGTGFDSGAINSSAIDWAANTGKIWWEELGRTTVGVAGDTISLTGLTAKRYLKIIFSALPTGGAITVRTRFNNDTGNNYAARGSANGGAESVTTSVANMIWDNGGSSDSSHFGVMDVINITNQEKICTGMVGLRNGSGASSAPQRVEIVSKWANTSGQITRIDLVNVGAGDFAIGSEVIVLGHD